MNAFENLMKFHEQLSYFMFMWAKVINALIDAEQYKAAQALIDIQPDLYYIDKVKDM